MGLHDVRRDWHLPAGKDDDCAHDESPRVPTLRAGDAQPFEAQGMVHEKKAEGANARREDSAIRLDAGNRARQVKE